MEQQLYMQTTVLGGRARLPWVWEFKRKERKIPKKEREKEKKEGFPDSLAP
jgi:hypothetical protein